MHNNGEHVADRTLNDDGTINIEENIHPWARQLAEDMDALLSHPIGEDLEELWHPRSWPILLHDDELRDSFLKIDAKALRSDYTTHKWAPVGTLSTALPAVHEALSDGRDNEMLPSTRFVCRIQMPNGQQCGCPFRARKQLVTHQACAGTLNHGFRSLFSLAAVDNKCLLCSTTFSDRNQCGRHMQRAWNQDRCIKNNTQHIYPWQQACAQQCTFMGTAEETNECNHVWTDPLQLRAHLRAHLLKLKTTKHRVTSSNHRVTNIYKVKGNSLTQLQNRKRRTRRIPHISPPPASGSKGEEPSIKKQK